MKIEDEIKSDPNIIYVRDDESDGGSIVDFTGGCRSVGELILQKLELGENRVAFVDGILEKQITFSEIKEQSLCLAKSLIGLGVCSNDVISIVSENRLEFIPIALSALYLGAIVAPINVMYTEREFEHAFKLSSPKFIFTSGFAAKAVIKVAKKLNFVKNVCTIDPFKSSDKFILSYKNLQSRHNSSIKGGYGGYIAQPVDIHNQTALILCSSGTTGLPKGVEITHANMLVTYSGLAQSRKLIEMVYNESITAVSVTPWFHVLGFMGMFITSCSESAKNIFLARFDGKNFLKCIEKYRANFAIVVPPIMVFLAKTPLLKKYDLSSLREIGCGAASMSKELEDEVCKRFNDEIVIRQGYGMTETTYGILQQQMVKKPGSVGNIMKHVYAKVIDEEGNSLGPNQKGELCFKGPLIMKGYIGNDEATKETIDEKGWLHSGDIGYYDEDFAFFIVDRIKELIKYKGFQVPPAEIEALLLTHPKINDAGVIGIPDQEAGELPMAFVVKKPGTKVTEKEIIDFVAENVSKPKQLHGGVQFIDEIPKNPSGKILRRLLREKLASKVKAKL